MFAESMLIFRQGVIKRTGIRNITDFNNASIKQRKIPNQRKEALITPLFNTNFISKSFKITDLTTCGERHETF
jgi:hypothetical protein